MKDLQIAAIASSLAWCCDDDDIEFVRILANDIPRNPLCGDRVHLIDADGRQVLVGTLECWEIGSEFVGYLYDVEYGGQAP